VKIDPYDHVGFVINKPKRARGSYRLGLIPARICYVVAGRRVQSSGTAPGTDATAARRASSEAELIATCTLSLPAEI
jgi:hypothetical protein